MREGPVGLIAEIRQLLDVADARGSWRPLLAAVRWLTAIVEGQQRHEAWAVGEIERLEHRISELEAQR